MVAIPESVGPASSDATLAPLCILCTVDALGRPVIVEVYEVVPNAAKGAPQA